MPVFAAVKVPVDETISAAEETVQLVVADWPVVPNLCSLPSTYEAPVVQLPAVSPSGPLVPTIPIRTSSFTSVVPEAPEDGVVLLPVASATSSNTGVYIPDIL